MIYLNVCLKCNTKIQKSARRDIIATEIAQNLWTRQETDELKNFIAWRYLGTETGIYRVYPAVQLSDNFDPVLAPW